MGSGSSTTFIRVDINPNYNFKYDNVGCSFKNYNQTFNHKPLPPLLGGGQEQPKKATGFTMGVLVGVGVTVTVIGGAAWTVFHSVTNPVIAIPAAKLSFGTSMAIIKGLMTKGAVAAAL